MEVIAVLGVLLVAPSEVVEILPDAQDLLRADLGQQSLDRLGQRSDRFDADSRRGKSQETAPESQARPKRELERAIDSHPNAGVSRCGTDSAA